MPQLAPSSPDAKGYIAALQAMLSCRRERLCDIISFPASFIQLSRSRVCRLDVI